MKYAYKVIDDAGNIACHQSENPSSEYPFVFDTPLEAGARIIDGNVVLPETPAPAPVYVPTAEELRQQRFAEVNWEYQDKLRKLRDTINALEAQGKSTDKIKAQYTQVIDDYKTALLDVAK